jgi:hypothetical protein
MARHQTIRIRPAYLKADQQAYVALQSIRDYAPINPAYARDKVQAGFEALQSARENLIRLQNELAAARGCTVAAEWEFHNLMLGAKGQVLAQYGDSSNEIQSMGLKKKSEYKPPVRPRRSNKTSEV